MKKSKTLIDVALNNTDRLSKMIDDLLDIEKMEAGKMTFDLRRLVVRSLIDDAVDMNRGYADRFGVSLEVSEAVDGDFEILFIGKFALKQLHTLEKLIEDGMLLKPDLLPRYLDDLDAMKRLDRVRSLDITQLYQESPEL